MRLRALLLAFAFAVFAVGPANAREWNAYTPCDELKLTRLEVQDYAGYRFCEPDALAEFHRAFAAPPLGEVAGAGRAVRVLVFNRSFVRPHFVGIDVVQRAGREFAIVRGEATRRRGPTMSVGLSAADLAYVADGAARLESVRAISPMSEICMHYPEMILETHGFGEPRTLRRGYCDDDAEPVAYGGRIIRLVLASFSRCRRIDRDELSFMRLKACVEENTM